jgi:hypothetical protein
LRLCGEKIPTNCAFSDHSLVPGKRYAFRIRVLGPNELESPWSEGVTCMVRRGTPGGKEGIPSFPFCVSITSATPFSDIDRISPADIFRGC